MRACILIAAALALAGCANLPGGEATIYPPNQQALSEHWMMTNDPRYPWEFHPQISGRD